MSTLLPDPAHLQLDLVRVDASGLTVLVASTAASASCPLCGQLSQRSHSRYIRTLADLPWAGVAVRLQLTLRRFFCDAPGCQRRIFAERLPTVAAPYARRTLRLSDAFELMGLLFGGEGGALALSSLAMATSADTILRAVRAAKLPSTRRPVSWAWMTSPSAVVNGSAPSSSIWSGVAELISCPIARRRLSNNG